MTWRELKEIVLAMDEKHLDEEVKVLTINHDCAVNLKLYELNGVPALWEERE